MKLSDLRPSPGAMHRRKRVGIGTGSGHGGTCCRGSKGQRSRSGGRSSRTFEGGQLPIHRRVPKGGFTPLSPNRFQLVNVRDLGRFASGTTGTPASRARWKPPFLNGWRQPSRVRVPSANTTTVRPDRSASTAACICR